MSLTKEQLEERRNFIGGGDAAGIMGLSRWASPLSIWADKTGNVEINKPEKLYQWLGTKLESVVAERFTLETGKKVHRVNDAIVHPKYPFIRAHIDRRIVGEDAILECKTCTPFKSKEWGGDEIPSEYLIQCHHYLAVTGAQKAYIAVLIGNQDFKYKEIVRDEKIINSIIEKEVYFWQEFVVKKQMPMQISHQDSDVLYQLFPTSNDSEIELTDEADALAESIEALTADKLTCEEQIEQDKNKLKIMLKENTKGVARKHYVTWKKQGKKTIDSKRLEKEEPAVYKKFTKETSFKVMRINRIEEKGDK